MTNILEGAKDRISKFFLHLVAYGGFNFNKGIIYLWNDIHLFIPTESYYVVQKELINRFGDDAKDILFWLGKLNGKTGTVALVKRFGLKSDNLKDLLNGASIDGWGKLEIDHLNYKNRELIDGIIFSPNSTLPQVYLKQEGTQNESVDFFILGELCGGAEPLFNKNIHGKEIKCIAKGDERCEFLLKLTDKIQKFPFLNKLKYNENEIIKKVTSITLNRPSAFNNLKNKNIKFGDGSLVFYGIKGILTLSYVQVILNEIVKNFDKKFYSELLQKRVDSDINILMPLITPLKNVEDILDQLQIFGYGKFVCKIKASNVIVIELLDNPYAKDYLMLFGRSKETQDDYICILIRTVFELKYNKKYNVSEEGCIAKGNKSCTFKFVVKN